MAEQDQNNDQDQTRAPVPPPKESPFPKPEPSAEADPRRSSRITPPPEAETPSVGSPRRTSRISLPKGAEPMAEANAPSGLPKTIRVIRPPAPGSAPTPQPGANPLPPGPKPLSPPQVQATKSKTSRISLESAIAAEPKPTPLVGPDGAPKTIRLKRPSEMPTLKVPAVYPPSAASATVPPGPRATAPIAPHPTPTKTARIMDVDVAQTPSSAASANVPLTQKRTIRVRRPGASTVSTPPETENDEAEVALTPLSPEEAGGPVKDSCNPVFIVAAAASIIVTGVLAFLFYQQLYGPTALY